METENFRIGEIVWARVVYPHQWWPGLVIRTDFLGVLVSFFNSEKSRYFLPSEICSFEKNFRFLVEKCTSRFLLNRALKSLGNKVILGLNCCGQGKRRQNAVAKDLFRPQVVSGFVRSVAVSPWVEQADFLIAVNALAQVMAFRHYCLVSSGVKSRVHADQASVEQMHSVAVELDNLEMGDGYQKFSQHADNYLSACLTDGKNNCNTLRKESFSLQDKDQFEICSTSRTSLHKKQSPQGMMVKLQILCIDPFYLDEECLNSLKSSFLSFRSLSHQNTFGTLCKKCSPIEIDEAQLPNHAYITSQQCINVHGGKEKTDRVESPVNCQGLKRQLDQSAFVEPPLKLRKTLSFSLNGAGAFLWRSNEGFNAVFSNAFLSGNDFAGLFELFKTMPLSSVVAYAHLLGKMSGCEADLFDSFLSWSQVKLKTLNLPSFAAQSLTYVSSSSMKDLVLNLLNVSLAKHTSSSSDILGVCRFQKLGENVDTLDNSGTHISYASMQPPQQNEVIRKRHGTSISYADDVTEKVLQPSAAQSVTSYANGVLFCDDEASDEIEGASKYQLNSHLRANELNLRPSNRDKSRSVKIKREISMDVAWGCSFKDKKDLLRSVTSDLACKSKVRRQPEVKTSFTVSRSLLMKFPKDCSLPSKEQLVKKFSPFGTVDSFKTKVYFYTGSARVVFLHQLDAMAAYQYAKRKKIAFGKENVKFWLDPWEGKRESKELVSFPAGTGNMPGFTLKSCLKKSKPLGKEDKRCLRKVRFRIET